VRGISDLELINALLAVLNDVTNDLFVAQEALKRQDVRSLHAMYKVIRKKLRAALKLAEGLGKG